jgi:hypothetical protein
MNWEEASMGKTKWTTSTQKRSRWFPFAIAVLIAAGMGAVLVAWSDSGPLSGSSRRRAPGDRYETLSPGQLPTFATGNAKAEEAYRYAAANPEVLQYIPCYCGCGNIGHRHNADCYVQERHGDDQITFTSHGAT